LKHISLYTTRENTLNCRGKRLAFSIFIYIAIENNLNFLEKRNLESWAYWSFVIVFVEFFHTSIRYQMSLYILVENFTAHLLVQNLGQRIETIWRKIKNKIWLIFSGPPVIYIVERKVTCTIMTTIMVFVSYYFDKLNPFYHSWLYSFSFMKICVNLYVYLQRVQFPLIW
jgi:hypothetical protein